MSSPTPVPPVLPGAAIPWYQSSVQKGHLITAISALIALSPRIAKMLGLTTPDAVASLVEVVFGIGAFVGPVIGSFIRAHSTLQPLTLTQGNADVHPATIAAERAAAVPDPFVATSKSGVSQHAPLPPPPAPPHVSFSDPKP
jgi:hypothetical protein